MSDRESQMPRQSSLRVTSAEDLLDDLTGRIKAATRGTEEHLELLAEAIQLLADCDYTLPRLAGKLPPRITD
jgi:hypothetical protein